MIYRRTPFLTLRNLNPTQVDISGRVVDTFASCIDSRGGIPDDSLGAATTTSST